MFRALLQTVLAIVLWAVPTFGAVRLINGREEALRLLDSLSFLTHGHQAPSSGTMLTFLVCTMIVLPWAMNIANKLDSSEGDEQPSFSFE